MRILSGLMLVLATLMACRQAELTPPGEALPATGQDSLRPPATLALSPGVKAETDRWPAFNTLQERMEAIYRTQGNEDLELLLEELVEACMELEASDFPEGFDLPSVRSREKVFRTFLQKTRADLHYRLDPRESLDQALDAYNALREQLNRVAAGTFDPTIFDHENK